MSARLLFPYPFGMPPIYPPPSKPSQQSRRQRIESRLAQTNTQKTETTSQAPSESDSTSSPASQNATHTNARSNNTITTTTEHPDRSRLRHEERVSAFFTELEQDLQTTRPDLYARLQRDYPKPDREETPIEDPSRQDTKDRFPHRSSVEATEATASNRRRSARDGYSASEEYRHISPGSAAQTDAQKTTRWWDGGGPQQTGANSVPVSGRQRDFGVRGGSGESRGAFVADSRSQSGSGGSLGVGAGRAEVGHDGRRLVVDTRGELGHREESAIAPVEKSPGDSAINSDVEEGEAKPGDDWARTADW